MRNLIKFIGLYNYSITFYSLFLIGLYFLINENIILKSKYFNSSNYISGSIYNFQSSITEYFNLREKNELLQFENKLLIDRVTNFEKNTLAENDQYDFIDASVINNSIRKKKNYLTIDKGYDDGIREGMGVISNSGVVGKIKYVSKNFSTVISLLNTSYYVSSLISNSNTLSSVNWLGENPEELNLLYVPKHIEVYKGDSVITSSFDSIFPKGILLGQIISINKDVNSNFYDISMRSSQNFFNLSSVYVIDNNLMEEKKNLEIATDEK